MSTNDKMTPRERLDAVFALKAPDRTPILGGWIACPAHIMEIAGVGEANTGTIRKASASRRIGRLGRTASSTCLCLPRATAIAVWIIPSYPTRSRT